MQDGSEELNWSKWQIVLEVKAASSCSSFGAVAAKQELQTDYKTGTINPGSHNSFDRLSFDCGSGVLYAANKRARLVGLLRRPITYSL